MANTGGRPSTVKEWMDHKDKLRRLYVDERKRMDQVIAIMQAEHGLTVATKRPLWNLFRKWKFPTRKSTATPIDDVVLARIRELWMQNVGQAELHRILTEEDGYNITKRALVMARKKHKMLFRSPQGDRADEDEAENPSEDEDEDEDGDGDGDGDDDDVSASDSGTNDVNTSSSHQPPPHNHQHQPHQHPPPHPHPHPPVPAPLAPMALMETSPPLAVFPTNPTSSSSPPVSRGHSKPRRLTRKHGIRPRDVTTPPRFPSELTLDESKAILGLEKESYKAMRAIFTQICEEASVLKKTLAGPERWEALKDDLIRRFPPLEAEMWQSRDNLDRKKLALDIICCDCTKRMRVKERHFALTQSRDIMGLNPYETRQARVVFYALVERHAIRSKTHAGIAKWNELKNEWVATCPYVQRVLAGGPSDPAYEDKLKALERLAQDVMKRRWHDNARARKKQSAHAATPGAQSPDEPAAAQVPEAAAHTQAGFEFVLRPGEMAGSSTTGDVGVGVSIGGNQSQAAMTSSNTAQSQATPTPSSLLVGTAASSLPGQEEVVLDPRLRTAPATQQPPVQAATPAPAPTVTVPPGPPSSSTAIFLRPHESSTFPTGASVWIGTIDSRSVREVRRAAVERYPGATCLRVEGILRDSRGAEMPLLIQGDAELEAYLAHLNGTTPTFAVQLVPGWEPT
ncbi:hypothetical protein ACRALDRAFT_1080783 [Sodiomyces alcalophilus JCM 7366]|uniref:uncharacterized protein n=1 Tax=Sodiomyces alcalophilus JCM 7366 TaxID=591952 RepID=UPI0039B44D1E